MHGVIVWAIHAGVHHEDSGLDRSAFAGIEDHRTDGQIRRSAPLQDFDVWFLLEAQHSVASVGDFDGELPIVAKLDITVVEFLLVDHDLRGAAPGPTTITTASLISQHERGDQ
jgi:hypothetical protein